MRKLFILALLCFLFGCSVNQDVDSPDCGILEEHLNTEMRILPVHETYELNQPIVVKLENQTQGLLVSDPNDFKIKIYKKSKESNDWIVIGNSSKSTGLERRIIESNSSVYFGFFPDLLDVEATTEIFVCLYAYIYESQDLIGATYYFSLE